MKIGMMLTFLDFRRDVHKVLEQLLQHHEVIIFMRQNDLQQFENANLPALQFRVIDEKVNSFTNFFMERLYLLLKKLPLSKQNYFLMEAFKAQNAASDRLRKKAGKILNLQKRLPKIMSYELYLNRLKYTSNTRIDDIDQFIFLTELYDDYLIARIRKLKKEFKIYVYSWDHPCKHSKFLRHATYLVWSKGLKDDLMNLQHIDPAQVSTPGASQFGFIEAFMNRKKAMPSPYPFEYVYFGCAAGIEAVAVKEIQLILRISKLVSRILPLYKLVVRPYPLLKNRALYTPVQNLENVVFDEDIQADPDELIYLKYKKIEGAKAYFHIGTTLGLEACLLGVKSFILNFGYTNSGDGLYHFIHQYQNEKYLIQSFPDNCINSISELEQVLLALDDPKFNRLTESVKKEFPVLSFESFSNKLIAT